jgi:hypothetical protein
MDLLHGMCERRRLRDSPKWDMENECQLVGMTYAGSTKGWRSFCWRWKETVLYNSLGLPVEWKALFVCSKKLTKRMLQLTEVYGRK